MLVTKFIGYSYCSVIPVTLVIVNLVSPDGIYSVEAVKADNSAWFVVSADNLSKVIKPLSIPVSPMVVAVTPLLAAPDHVCVEYIVSAEVAPLLNIAGLLKSKSTTKQVPEVVPVYGA